MNIVEYVLVTLFASVAFFGAGAALVVVVEQIVIRQQRLRTRSALIELRNQWQMPDDEKTPSHLYRQRMLEEIIYRLSTSNDEQLEAHYISICATLNGFDGKH